MNAADRKERLDKVKKYMEKAIADKCAEIYEKMEAAIEDVEKCRATGFSAYLYMAVRI